MVTFQADEECLDNFSSDIDGLWCRPIAILDKTPDSFVFLREFVHPSVPCIIRNAIPARSTSSDSNDTTPLNLTLDDIISHVGEDIEITVDVTPDGHGDCVRNVVWRQCCDEEWNGEKRLTGVKSSAIKKKKESLFPVDSMDKDVIQRMFVKPHEQRMTLGQFRHVLRAGNGQCRKSFHEISDKDDRTDEKIQSSLYHENEIATFPLKSSCPDRYSHRPVIFNPNKHLINPSYSWKHPPVVYYSRQNDCLRTEMSKLFSTQLFPCSFPFAEEAFAMGPPEAINLWIGNQRSISSTHKDHYENLFYVCSGQKEFILFPPADILFLHEGEFSSGIFEPVLIDEREDRRMMSWVVAPEFDLNHKKAPLKTVKWIEPDINRCLTGNNQEAQFSLLSKAHPIKVLVSAGEMLYIPSLWYHRVTQTCETVAVNYWYDMRFSSPHWCYFNFIQQMKRKPIE